MRARYGQAGKLVLDTRVMPGLAQRQVAAAHSALPTELLGLSYLTSAVTVAPGGLDFLLHETVILDSAHSVTNVNSVL